MFTITVNPELVMHGDKADLRFDQDIKVEMSLSSALLLANCAETSHYDVLKHLADNIQQAIAQAFPSGRPPERKETQSRSDYPVQCANAFRAKSDVEVLEDVQRGLNAVYDGHNLPDAIIDGQMYDMKTTGQCLTGSEGTNAIVNEAEPTPTENANMSPAPQIKSYQEFLGGKDEDGQYEQQEAYNERLATDVGSHCDSCGSYISECVCNWDAADESESLMHQEVNEGVMDEDAVHDMLEAKRAKDRQADEDEEWEDLDEDGDPNDPEKGLENKIPVGYKEP